MLIADCTKKELTKFGDKCAIWLEKSLANDGDKSLVWASLRSVLESEWVEILGSDPKINEKSFDDIYMFDDIVTLKGTN